ncbi:23S rRNA pseudouridine(2605) synthase RluB [Alginatibacterium sediminis]|uniref:Pseudouridine synthase n=1 Tax=Alginatibacterium sediminis TaxID=2164068 RepID=A0A420EI80_9ALTE|nr:23S rRNA pseudouridine(2605) synthase RluB [Alginatibacterium sediminis]RKF20395.1 23S rRNA pseudouridine(2605) synthase RluB [Alginatibacterium sediminis]
MSEKLQKVLARSGKGSRREMETYIDSGRVLVNGKVAKLGDRVEESDVIRLDGHSVDTSAQAFCRVLIYNKDEGEICTRQDPEGRPTVFDRLPPLKVGRWVAVGRLDINTSGLMLFTTDGELANRLMHPRFEIEREYAVRVFGEVSDKNIQNLRQGVELEDGKANFTKIMKQPGEGINHWYHVTLNEGRNREVRRLWESQDCQVSRLIRVRYGKMALPKALPRSGWQDLGLEDVNYLLNLVQLPEETQSIVKVGEKTRVNRARIRKSVRKHRMHQQKAATTRRRR